MIAQTIVYIILSFLSVTAAYAAGTPIGKDAREQNQEQQKQLQKSRQKPLQKPDLEEKDPTNTV